MAYTLPSGASFSQQRPPREYSRLTPNVFNAVSSDRDILRWFYGLISQSSVEVPAEGYIYLPHCYAFDGRFLLDDELNWIEPTLNDWCAGDDVKEWVKDNIRSRSIEDRNLRGTDWHHVLFAQCNAENYGHFLCEAAPKLINILQAGFKKIRYILPAGCARYEPFIDEILAYAGVVSEAMIAPEASFSGWFDLLYFTPVSQHDFRKSPTLLEFRDVAVSCYGVKGPAERKLLIQRSAGDRRRVTNDQDIASSLSEDGYEAVYPGLMTIPEQIGLFSQASNIVGSVGAGLTNMLFSPSQTKVFYVSNGLIDPFFWDLSGLCDQIFTWFFARPIQRFNHDDFTSGFHVDLGTLRNALFHKLTQAEHVGDHPGIKQET